MVAVNIYDSPSTDLNEPVTIGNHEGFGASVRVSPPESVPVSSVSRPFVPIGSPEVVSSLKSVGN